MQLFLLVPVMPPCVPKLCCRKERCSWKATVELVNWDVLRLRPEALRAAGLEEGEQTVVSMCRTA